MSLLLFLKTIREVVDHLLLLLLDGNMSVHIIFLLLLLAKGQGHIFYFACTHENLCLKLFIFRQYYY